MEPTLHIISDPVVGPDHAHHSLISISLPALPPQSSLAMALAVVIDRSASMERHLPQTREALTRLLRACSAGTVLSLVSFSDEARVELPAAACSPAHVQAGLKAVRALSARGGTKMSMALGAALKTLAEAAPEEKRILFLTDGRNGEERQRLERVVKACVEHKVAVSVWGLGQEWDEQELLYIARTTGGEANCVFDARELAEAFLGVLRRQPRLEGLHLHFRPAPDVRMKLLTRVYPDILAFEPNVVNNLGGLEAGATATWHLELEAPGLNDTPRNIVRVALTWPEAGRMRQLPVANLRARFSPEAQPGPEVTHYRRQTRAVQCAVLGREALARGDRPNARLHLRQALELAGQAKNLSMTEMLRRLMEAPPGDATAQQTLKTMSLQLPRTVPP